MIRIIEKYIFNIFIGFGLFLGLFRCSNGFEIKAVFRGDSPLYFNVTSLRLSESEVSPFTLELRKAPTADVTITLASSDTSQITLDPPVISFTPSNYETPQTIRVLGMNDCLSDGTKNVTIDTVSITSADPTYNNIANVTIPVTVNDSVDNLPNIIFFQTSDMVTSEMATVAFFKVNISCPIAPSTSITVPLIVDKPGEVAIDKTSLVFTDLNYSTYQTVTVTGKSDCVLDADQPFTIKTGNVTSSNPTETRFARYTTAGMRSVANGTNLNYAVNEDTIISAPAGSLGMTLQWNTGVPAHVDQFVSFSVSLTCPIVNPVYFSFEGTDITNVTNFANASLDTATNSFAKVANTSLGNKYLIFNSTNWDTAQNVIIGLNTVALFPSGLTDAALISGFGAIHATAPFYDSTNYKIIMYQSIGDANNTPVASPAAYPNKTLNANITVNNY